MNNLEKVKYLLPGEKAPLDTTMKTVNVTSSILLFVLIFIVLTSIVLKLIWFDFPFLHLPKNNPAFVNHIKGFWTIIIGLIIPLFQGNYFVEYRGYLDSLTKTSEIELIAWRWLLSIVIGLGFATWGFLKSLIAVGGDKHIIGKQLLKGKEAILDLTREFGFLSKDGRGSRLVVLANKGYDPRIHKFDTLKKGSYIELPEKLRRSHFMFIGGTGRGKTQLIYYRLVAQLDQQIKDGEVVKLLCLDTPKSDYSKYFRKQQVLKISPHEEGGLCWAIAYDLTDGLLANAFWKGKIPANESDPIWGNAAISVGTGCTRYLQVIAPKAWNYGMLAHLLTKSGEDLEPLLSLHYPEAKQILNSSGDTLSSVLFNLGTYTQDLISLGRIYDGFDIKKSVHQSTAKALKNAMYVEFVFVDMVRSVTTPGLETQNISKALMFKGACLYLTKTCPEWTWKDLSAFVQLPRKLQSIFITPYLDEEEAKIINNIIFYEHWMELAKNIIYYADEWDKLEAQPKLSIRDWILNENPSRKILILKPSETYPTLTEGLIKGILYYANSIILGDLKDDRKRRFHILIDELQSYGNIQPFIGPALSLYRSRGITLILAFQDLSQLVSIYKQEFVDFMNSNIGNIIILGVNDGFTANKLTELLGDKKIQRLHRHKSSDSGVNEDFQEHEEKVIYQNEWNLLGANDATMNIKYLYLIGGLNSAYILNAPILPYKTRNEPKKASWINATNIQPRLPDINELWGINPSIKQYKPPSIDEMEKENKERKVRLQKSEVTKEPFGILQQFTDIEKGE